MADLERRFQRKRAPALSPFSRRPQTSRLPLRLASFRDAEIACWRKYVVYLNYTIERSSESHPLVPLQLTRE